MAKNTLIDLTGQRFGRWTVVEHAGATARKQTLFKCRCDCGNEGIVRSTALRKGQSLSCGCLRNESIKAYHRRMGHVEGGKTYQKSTGNPVGKPPTPDEVRNRAVQLYNEGNSYREVAVILSQEGTPVSYSSVRNFVKGR